MKTKTLKLSEVEKSWWIADADSQVLGRLASKIAQILKGKHKVNYVPYLDNGDCVVVINAEKIKVSGNKAKDKFYHSHSGYPGGLKSISFEKLQDKAPERIIQLAVKGMLPRTPLGRSMLKKLKVYAGASHPHSAQQPQSVQI